MKSIKPGRGSSKMAAVGGIFAALFGLFWTIMAATLGAWFMIPFGLLFIGFSLYITIFHKHNATAEDRYSLVDIVDSSEESDPLNDIFGRSHVNIDGKDISGIPGTSVAFCPYCGAKVEGNFDFCPRCGKKLPD